MNALLTKQLVINLLSLLQQNQVALSPEIWAAAIELNNHLPTDVDSSYEIAKIFNTPTHQVVMLKTFEEEASEEQVDGDSEEDWGEEGPTDYVVSYSTSYQITQIMFHSGVRIARSYGFQEVADRDAEWEKLTQEKAQSFVDATVQFITDSQAEDDEDSSR